MLEPPRRPRLARAHRPPLPVGAAADWAVRPDCGAVVLFSGTARDHAPGRDAVERLEYEAYEEHVVPRLGHIAAAMREQWPELAGSCCSIESA